MYSPWIVLSLQNTDDVQESDGASNDEAIRQEEKKKPLVLV